VKLFRDRRGDDDGWLVADADAEEGMVLVCPERGRE
jgi:hypothetical protein